jgi:predicted RNA-binding Zn ribbon-like protein
MMTMNLSDERHTHDATLDDTLDFLNTLDYDRGTWVDKLPSSEVAVDWLASRGLAHPDERLAADPRTVERVAAVRSALRQIAEAIVHDRPAPRQALATANRVLRARSILELAPSEEGFALSHRHIGDPVADALARLVEPLVLLAASGGAERLHICDSDACNWIFYDTSRTGRRRWCDMSTCGNRAKAARHRAKRRVDPVMEPASA